MRRTRLLFLALAVAVPATQMQVDRRLGEFRAQEEILYLWSGEQIRRLTPGLENLMADIYWLRTIQYFGGQRAYAEEKRFDLLRPLVEITTTLDPRFEIAYRYGATFLSEAWPVGAGNPKAGIEVLEAGARRNPHNWRLRWDQGIIYFEFLGDHKRAAQVLLEAMKIPGAPFWLETLAADILGRGGDRETARRLWSRMYEQSEGSIRRNAVFHLRKLDALDGVDAIDRLVAEFFKRNGRLARSFEELRREGLLRSAPVDPTGVPFVYDPVTGAVSISKTSTLWRPGD